MNSFHRFRFDMQPRMPGQRGISLVIVMIFLVILSALGITAMQSSTFSSRIARNESDRNLAFQAAEAALRDAELDIKNLRVDKSLCTPTTAGCRTELINRGDGFDATCPLGRCDSSAIATPVWEDAAKWTTTGASVAYGTYTGAAALPVVAQQPRYLLEYFPLGDSTVYRITAVGFGANTSTQIMLQSAVKALPL
ncbi:pilus assembly PilX family protein [Polaromonas aquatica]|uniref:pilus assembly PilX family protein n=1 Tax=Polaromonas aquatica TaxID=332657 RepID=UPI003D65F007